MGRPPARRSTTKHRTGRTVLTAGATLLSATLASCSLHPGPSGETTVVFDGHTQTIDGPITCTAQPDGKLVILASDGGQQTVRVLLNHEHPLVVEKVGIRLAGASGYTDDAGDLWATKVDDSYTINGWLPPNAGEATRHQFEVDVNCRNEVPLPNTAPPDGNGLP